MRRPLASVRRHDGASVLGRLLGRGHRDAPRTGDRGASSCAAGAPRNWRSREAVGSCPVAIIKDVPSEASAPDSRVADGPGRDPVRGASAPRPFLLNPNLPSEADSAHRGAARARWMDLSGHPRPILRNKAKLVSTQKPEVLTSQGFRKKPHDWRQRFCAALNTF